MTGLLVGVGISTSAAADADPVEAAVTAERLGYDFVSASDHPVGRHPTYDTPTLLTWIAARTSRIAIASRVLAVPFRLPAVLAKSTESLQRLSGGRLILGLGGGYDDDEIRALGLPPHTPREKVDGLADALQILRGAWTRPGFTHHGAVHSVHDLDMEPKPDRPIPIWLGTFGNRALAVTGRLADGWIPSHGYAPPEQIAAMRDRVIGAAVDAGRDPDAIRCVYHVAVRLDPAAQPTADLVAGSAGQIVDQLARFLDLGFTGLSLTPTGPDVADQVRALADEVLPELRAAVPAK